MLPVNVRESLVDALRLDLVGPSKGSPLEAEVLSQRPSAWYPRWGCGCCSGRCASAAAASTFTAQYSLHHVADVQRGR